MICEGCGFEFVETDDEVLEGDVEICERCGLVLCGDCGAEMAGRDPKLCDTCKKENGV